MSATAEHTVWCDAVGCDERFQPGLSMSTPRLARARARRAGWVTFQGEAHYVDLCLKCARKRQTRTSA